MDLDKISFWQAIKETDDRRRHLLLGNGFSISAYEGFKYGSLMEAAVGQDPSLATLFEDLHARDFEHVMALAPERAFEVRQAFIKTVAAIHPARSEALTLANREACADFLALFARGKRHPLKGRIFTTNYDLLLCWVLVEHKARLDCWDGFDAGSRWNSERLNRSFVHYLHGGLHIYERPGRRLVETKKLRADWSDARSLVDVVRTEVTSGHFPTFVSEGTHVQKTQRINSSNYLTAASAAFAKACGEKSSAIFTLGHSLSRVDHHILGMIAKGNFARLYIGIFSDADEERARRLAFRWREYRAANGLPTLELRLFASRDAPVWTRESQRVEM